MFKNNIKRIVPFLLTIWAIFVITIYTKVFIIPLLFEAIKK